MAARYPIDWREEAGGAPGALCWIIRGPLAGRFVNILGTPAEIAAGEAAGDWQRASEFTGHQFMEPRPDEDSVSIPPPPPPAVAPVNTALPTLSGTAQVGSLLTATNGTWTGTPTPTFARAWLRGGITIPGASGLTYTLVAADEGEIISVRVTASNSAGSVPAVSASTAAVAPAA